MPTLDQAIRILTPIKVYAADTELDWLHAAICHSIALLRIHITTRCRAQFDLVNCRLDYKFSCL